MCRFIAYSGPVTIMNPLVFQAENSLISQSKSALKRKDPVNADGFGIGWYTNHEDPEPATFVNVDPAWSNRNLRMISNKVLTSHYFAHVRDASVNMPVNQANCHPFQNGKYLWMHNGRIDKFEKIRRALLLSLSEKSFSMVQGNTDSEHAFALFMDVLEHKENATQDELVGAMIETIRRIMVLRKDYGADTCALMNFALTDGYNTIATRFGTCEQTQPASLFYGLGALQEDQEYIHFTKNTGKDENSILICSEQVTTDRECWEKVERNHIVIAKRNIEVIQKPIDLPYQREL